MKLSLVYGIMVSAYQGSFRQERSIEKCQQKDAITKTEFCVQERAREKTEDMPTNIPIPLANSNLFTHGN